MKRQAFILIIILSIFAGKVAGQCTADISGGTSPICYNTSPGTFTATGGGGTTYTYQWYTTSGIISGETNSTYNPGNITATTGYYCAITSGECGTVNTSTTTITVDDDLTAVISGGTSPICYDTSPGTFTATGGGGTGSYTYQWYTTSGSIGGATSSTYNPGNITATTGYYCAITSGSCGTVNTSTTTITVDDNLTAGISGGTSPICYDTSPGTFTATGGGGTGSYTYQWYTTSGSIGGATSSTYNPGNITATTGYYCAITSGSCGTVNTSTTTITVDDNLTAGISGGTSPICYDTSPGTFTATGGGGTGSYTYQWYTTSGSIGGATSSTYNPGNITATTGYYCAITSGSCGTVNTSTTTITVDDNLTAGISGGTSPICYDTSPGTFTATGGGGTGSYTYQWYTTSGSIGGATSSTYNPGNITATTGYYCAITSGSCGTVNTSTTTITVDDNLTAGISGGTSPICYDTSPGTFTATGGGGTGSYTYQWYTTSGSIGGATSSTYNPGNITATTGYYCAITSGSCGTVNTSTTTITVDDNLTAGISGGTSPICYDTSPGTFTATGGGGTGSYTYQWYTTSGSIGGATSSTYNPGNITATTGYYCAITSGSCGTVNTSTTTITVDGNLTAAISGGTSPICYNTSPGTFTATGGGGTGSYTYQWYTTSGIIGGATSSTYNPGNITATTGYYCAITSGSCGTVNTSTTTITVHGNKTANISGGTSPICYNTSPGLFTATGSGGGGSYTYQWYTTSGMISGATSSTYDPGNITSSIGYYCILTTPSCGTVNTSTTSITVFQQITLTGVSQASAVCSGSIATINLTGLLAGSTSTVAYTVDGVAHSASGVGADVVTGAASFPTVPLTPANNGKILQITGITTTSTTPNCSATFALNTTLIVNTASVPALTGPLSPCVNSIGNVYTTDAGMTGYSWNVSAGGSVTAGGTGTSNSVTVIWNTAGAQTVSVNYTNTNGCTAASPTVDNITVKPLPVPTITGPAVVCVNSSGNVYTTESGMPSYTWSVTGGNIMSGGNGSNMAVITWTSSGNQTVSVNYTNSNNCSAASPTINAITVNPTGQVNDPANQVVCNSASTTSVSFGTTNTGGTTTYSWTNNNTSIGLGGSGTGNISAFTAINNGTSPVTATITVTPHFTNGSVTCDGPAQAFTITVNPTGQVNDPANQVVCNSASTTSVSFGTTNTGGTTTYSWTNNNNSIGLGGSGTGNISAFTAINNGTSPVTATITVTPHFTNGSGTCDGPSQVFTITVNPTGQVNDPANQVVCNGASTTLVSFGTTNTGGITTYSWTNNNTSIGLGGSGTGNISAFTAINNGTSPVTATITVTPHFTNGSVTCDGPSQAFTITVNPTGQVNDPANQVVCNGASTTLVSFGTTNTGGTTTYSWTNNNTSIGLGGSGTGNISAFTAINNGTSLVTATITVTPHFTNGSVTCDGTSQAFTITVNPTGQVNDPANQVVCNGASTTLVSFGTTNTGGITTYSWTNDQTTIGLPASGTGNISAFTAINNGTSPVTATITVTPHFTNGSVTCDGPSQVFTITVNPTGQVNDPANQVVCNGASTTLVSFGTTNTGGITTYSWTNDQTTIGLPASGTGNISSFTAINNGTSPVTATITVTPHFTNGSVTCDGPAQVFTITVNPTGQVNDPANQVVCNGASTTLVSFGTTNTGGITTYSWTNDQTTIGLPASGTGNISSFTAINNGTSPVTATITVTPHFTNGSVTCDGTSQAFTITVNPTGQVNDPANQVVCNGASTTLVSFGTTNTGGITTYSWTNDQTTIGLPASGTGNISSFTAINNGTSPVTATITVTPHFTNGSVTCDGTSQAFTITVNPTGQVNDPANQVVCNGASTTLVSFGTTNTGGITTYSWTNDQTTIGLPASGTGNISSFTAINNGTSPVTATITVTPHFTNGSVTCDGPAQVFTITVNPTGQVNDPANQVVCNGASTTLVSFGTTNTGGITTYSWTNDQTTIGLPASGTGNISSFTAINNGTSPVTATITMTPHFTNGSVTCDGPAQAFTITVNPLPVPTITGPASVLVNSIGNVYTTESGMVAYSWTVSAGGTVTAGSTTNIITVTWNSPGAQTVSVNYTNGNNCTAANATIYNISVNAKPVASDVIILGDPRSGLTLNASYIYSDADGDPEGTSIYQWYAGTSSSGTGSSIIPYATAMTYKLTDAELGKYIGFSVTPVALTGKSPGDSVTTVVWAGPVINDPPEATAVFVTGSLNVNGVLTGHYTYSDKEGDIESGTSFRWLSSDTPSGTYSAIAGETAITHVITLSEQGKYFKFYVTPEAASGTGSGMEVSSPGYGPVNTKPSATGVTITGSVTIGSTLTGNYTYNDVDGDIEGLSTFKWFRNGVEIADSTLQTYTIVYTDEASSFSFQVTPVSATGYPNTGTPVTSAETIPVPLGGTLPVVSEVCIEGIRETGNVIRGEYLFTYNPSDDYSVYRWMRDNDTIPGETSITYTLTSADINHDIYFVVYPYSKPPAHKRGITVKSNSLARIVLSKDSYSLADPQDTLKANVGGGVFSGPGVINGIFSPVEAGIDGSPYTISYLMNILNTSTSCSQEAFADIAVLPVGSYFERFKNVYCHDGGEDTINVTNIPAGATSKTFRLTNPAGEIRLINDTTIIIDPGKMRPGNKIDTLFFSYFVGTSFYPISHPFVIDSIGTSIAIVNMDNAYCAETSKQYITIEGAYPGGGVANWTGTLMTEETSTSAFLDPLLGTPGNTYPISYQYTSPLGCKSGILNKSVTINPLPNSSFALDATYNIDGGAKDLIAIFPGGNFIGPGVVGTTFYPDIAGQGTIEIKYSVTDINNCSSSTSETTSVRKVQGSFNELPSIICYRDTTYNISVTGLPSSGILSVNDFFNTKNSLVNVPGSVNAEYNIPAARSGNDTIKFSYTWDGVDYTLSKAVFIDSIGKIAITGLKDNYCDYDGTASLRVLVENSTGNGNFSFSGPDSSFTNYGSLADFFPSKTPTSEIPYMVSYTHVSTVNNSGCQKTATLPVTVNKSPVVYIIKTRTTVNYEESPVLLKGVPSDGIFSGKGVFKSGNNYLFNPVVSGLGSIGIMLSYVDSIGCSASDKDTLTVSQATGTIDGVAANSQYCYDGPADTLKYVPVAPYLSGSFIGPGINNVSAVEATFSPGLAGKGDHQISYRYLDLDSTVFDMPVNLKVDSLGQVSIYLDPGDVFCNNDPERPLLPSIPGGIFSGPVTDNSLDPSKEVGNTSVGYIYTNPKTGCSTSVSVPIIINAAPEISFAPADYCIGSSLDPIKFINSTISTDSVSSWLWQFADAGGSTSYEKEPSHIYKTGGLQNVTLTAKTVKNCSAYREITIDIGSKPKADFYWKNDCYHSNDSIMLFDSTTFSSPIVSRTWNFINSDSIHTILNILNPTYPKLDTGYLKVQYVVNTSYANCSDTITKSIYIPPTFVISPAFYSQNFETGKIGWVKEDLADSIWSFGIPEKDSTVINTKSNAWFTLRDRVFQKVVSSSIVSPCFDFSNSLRPMIHLSLVRQFELNRDGAVLQSRVGDGTWQPVGTVGDGIDWFNSSLIKGKPGGDQLGWTTIDTVDTKWKKVSHTLDELKGTKNVKFRIAFGSDGTTTSSKDGITFDSIWIGERTRRVLLEHFTNNSSKSAETSTATQMVNTIAQNKKEDVINIQYHTNFPGDDPFYDADPGDAGARILFYGLSEVPYSFLDGGNKINYANLYDYKTEVIDSNDVTRRSLINPDFNISLNTTISGGILSVNVQITALEDTSFNNLTLYLVVTEKTNSDYGETVFYNVFRKFIPDAGGISLKNTWAKGDVFTVPEQAWVIENIKSSSDIEVVAFIQNNITRQLYQAASEIDQNILTGIENPVQGNGTGFALYPNPAVNKLTIAFKDPLEYNAEVRIYDVRGVVIASYKVGSGSSEFTIENLGLKRGFYLLRISTGGVDLGFKKFIISGY